MTGRHTSQHELLLSSLTHYFSKGIAFQTVNDVLKGKTAVSLRLIDWFVVCYSKKHNTVIHISGTEPVHVYLHYRAQLRAFSKHLFDPFRRQEKMTLTHQSDTMLTTIGQLNFFRWALDYGVLNYIQEHVDDIMKDMNQTQKDMRQTGAVPGSPLLAVETASAVPVEGPAFYDNATVAVSSSDSREKGLASSGKRDSIFRDRKRECTVNNISVAEGSRRVCFD